MNRLDDLRHVFEEDAATAVLPAGVVDRAVRSGVTARRRRRAGAMVGSVVVTAAIAAPLLINQDQVADGPVGPSQPTATTEAPITVGPAPGIPYALGTTIIDGELRIEAPGFVLEMVAVGDQYAVLTPDPTGPVATGLVSLDLLSADGAVRHLDTGEISGLAAEEVAGRWIVAWGGVTVKRLLVEESTPSLLEPAPPFHAQVFDLVDGRVVYLELADRAGSPYLWNLDGTIDVLAAGDPGPVSAESFGPGVAAVFDDGTQCTYAVRVADPATRLWERCDGPLNGQLSPGGAWVLTTPTVVNPTTGAVHRLDLPFDLGSLDTMATGWESADVVLVGGGRENGSGVYLEIARCDVASGACELATLPDDPRLRTSGHSVLFAS